MVSGEQQEPSASPKDTGLVEVIVHGSGVHKTGGIIFSGDHFPNGRVSAILITACCKLWSNLITISNR